MTIGIFGEEMDASTVEQTKKILKKVKNPKEPKVLFEKQTKSKNISTEERIRLITENVHQILGKQKDSVLVITTRQDLRDYLSIAIENGVLAVDTETNNSLDPITCKLMGLCLYTFDTKQVYVPVNHIDYTTGKRLAWQLTEQDIGEELARIKTGVKLIFHNYKFDYQVIKCTCGVELPCFWDTEIAARLINENEPANLKEQYTMHVDPSQQSYKIEELFDKQEYSIFDPRLFALYAATDSLMTYKLYLYQKPIMESEEFSKIYKLFVDVELPCAVVTANMELNGVEVDLDYAARLSTKYHKQLEDIDNTLAAELAKLKSEITSWKMTPEANNRAKSAAGKVGKSKAEQLEDPINLGSPTQMAILFYDILKSPTVNKNSPRSTDEDTLKAIYSKTKNPICKALLDRRACLKLLSTYVDNIPELAKIWDDHRLRAHFNQMGTDTGRFSSGGKIKYRDKDGKPVEVSGINYQNIPSHEKSIRMLFKAKEGYTLVGADYGQQEPRLLSFLSRDKGMIAEGRDLYATIATGIYHNTYWDNMEQHEDGSPNPEGKKRRGNCKQVLLGIMYGLGVPNLAERMNITIEEAQKVMDGFYVAFPLVKSWQDATIANAKKYGYVEDVWGRRRRLPGIQLPEYEFIDDAQTSDFNPFLNCSDRVVVSNRVAKFKRMLDESLKKPFKERRIAIMDTISAATKEGVTIVNNRGKIVHAENQCVNARIQGSAATMTKKAMIAIFKDKELNDLDFKLLIGIHDELIGECPKENADKVASRLTYVMRNVVADDIDVPFKCDADVSDHWYFNDYSDVIRKEYQDYIAEKGMSKEQAFETICTKHSEMLRDDLRVILKEKIV